jgi:hypothetical protein
LQGWRLKETGGNTGMMKGKVEKRIKKAEVDTGMKTAE